MVVVGRLSVQNGGQPTYDQVRQLLSACEQGNVDLVSSLLDQGLNVDTADEEDITPLQVAAANGHECLVRQLIMRGAGLDKVNMYGWSAIMHAARHGHHAVVGLLLQSQAEINTRNRLGASVLSVACRGGHLQTVKLLVEAGCDLNPTTDSIGSTNCEFTPLMEAALHGHDSIVRYLLDRGLDVNYRMPSTGISALMLAALNGHMTTAQILIEREANPDYTDVNGHTALEVATIRGKREVRGYLDRKTQNKPNKLVTGDAKPDIIEAAKKGDYQRLVDILDNDLTQRDACSHQDGATPLIYAAMLGRLDMVSLLVERGCDINKQDSISGWTALMQATFHGKKTVAKFLINAGADVLLPAKNGCTAFDMACIIDDVDTELYRMLAAQAVQVSHLRKKNSDNWQSKNGSAVNTMTSNASTKSLTAMASTSSDMGDEQPRTGLKVWWNRMSNRFRNLKLGRTFNLQTNRLAPLETASSVPSTNESILKNSDRKAANRQSPQREVNKTVSVDSGLDNSVLSYDTLMFETRKSASLYTIGLAAPNGSIEDGTLKAVIPPFLPPPSYDIERGKMPPTTVKRSPSGNAQSLSARPIVQPMKILQTYASNQNLTSMPTSPSGRHVVGNSISPSSSGGASGLTASEIRSRVNSSASSSTLTGNSDSMNRHGRSQPYSHRYHSITPTLVPVSPAKTYLSAKDDNRSRVTMETRVSMKSSVASDASGSLLPRKHSGHQSQRSRDTGSTNSTLTPSPSPTPKPPGGSSHSSGSLTSASQPRPIQPITQDDELGGILKNLSLEKYQAIFEEQEVDMEAFLTLTDTDLKELGIDKTEPRLQILAAIKELKSGKGRERLQYQETLTQFNAAISSRSSNFGSDAGEFKNWTLRSGNSEEQVKSKSRAS